MFERVRGAEHQLARPSNTERADSMPVNPCKIRMTYEIPAQLHLQYHPGIWSRDTGAIGFAAIFEAGLTGQYAP